MAAKETANPKARCHLETIKTSNMTCETHAVCEDLLCAAILNAEKTLGTRLVMYQYEFSVDPKVLSNG